MAKVTMKQDNTPSSVIEDEVEKEQDEQEIVSDDDDNDDKVDDEELGQSVQIEDLPPDTTIWEGGPTVAQILEWKEEYGDVYITNVTYEKHVVWRTLRRPEYKQLVRQIEQLLVDGRMTQTEANMYNEELTCTICTLYPKYSMPDFENELAGLPSILSQQIMETSGFSTVDVRQL